MLKNKAIIFSIDSMIALFSAIILIGIAFFYISEVETLNWSQPSSYITALDTLNVLRIDKTLENSIKNNSNESLILFLNNMFPENICGKIQLFNSSEDLLIQAKKENCNIDLNLDIYVTRRTFVYNKSMYYAFLRLWYV